MKTPHAVRSRRLVLITIFFLFLIPAILLTVRPIHRDSAAHGQVFEAAHTSDAMRGGDLSLTVPGGDKASDSPVGAGPLARKPAIDALVASGQESSFALALTRAQHAVITPSKEEAALPGNGNVRHFAWNPGQKLKARFLDDTVRIASASDEVDPWELEISVQGGSREARSSAPAAEEQQVVYRRGEVSEWFVNRAQGFEHGFTVAAPSGSTAGRLEIQTSLSGLAATADPDHPGDLLLVKADGAPALRYAGLKVTDATGRALEASMTPAAGGIRFTVITQSARYPVVIDPLLTSYSYEGSLAAKIGQPADLLFGAKVALSGDTALVSAPDASTPAGDGAGVVYCLARRAGGQEDGGWYLQQRLDAGSDAGPFDGFGSSVAIDGDTAVVGSPKEDQPQHTIQSGRGGRGEEPSGEEGAAYIFQRSGATWNRVNRFDNEAGPRIGTRDSSWSFPIGGGASATVISSRQQCIRLRSEMGSARVLTSISLYISSTNGAVRNGFTIRLKHTSRSNFNGALAWEGGFTEVYRANVFPPTTAGWWTLPLSSSFTYNGVDNLMVDISQANSNLAVGSGYMGNSNTSDQRSCSTGLTSGSQTDPRAWSGTSPFAPSGANTVPMMWFNRDDFDYFGTSVAIDGDRLAVGAYQDENPAGVHTGSVTMFARSGGNWAKVGAFTPSGSNGEARFGASVAISGASVVVGAPDETTAAGEFVGAAYVFAGGAPWSQQARLTAQLPGGVDDSSVDQGFGQSVDIYEDRVIVGSPWQNWTSDGSGGNTPGVEVESAGAAYVYSKSGFTWAPEAKLVARMPDGTLRREWYGRFGAAVSLGADLAVVGSPGASSDSPRRGSAFVSGPIGGIWKSQAVLLLPSVAGSSPFNGFSSSIALDGGLVLVGESGAADAHPFLLESPYQLLHSYATSSSLGSGSPEGDLPLVRIPTSIGVIPSGGSRVAVGKNGSGQYLNSRGEVLNDPAVAVVDHPTLGRILVAKDISETIQVSVFQDINSDGVLDVGDTVLANELVKVGPFDPPVSQSVSIGVPLAPPAPPSLASSGPVVAMEVLRLDGGKFRTLDGVGDSPLTLVKDASGIYTSIRPELPGTGIRVPWRLQGTGNILWPYRNISYQMVFEPGPEPIVMIRDSEAPSGGSGMAIPSAGIKVTVVYAAAPDSNDILTEGVHFSAIDGTGKFMSHVPGRFVLKFDPTPENPRSGDETYKAVVALENDSQGMTALVNTAIGEEIRPPDGCLYGVVHSGRRHAVQLPDPGHSIVYGESRAKWRQSQIIPVNTDQFEIWWHREWIIPGTAGLTVEYPKEVGRYNSVWAGSYLTEKFYGTVDVTGRKFTFAPSVGEGGYTPIQSQISALPIDPAGGIPLSLADNSSAQAMLQAGRKVRFFGNDYDSFYINSNGSVSFGQGNPQIPSLATHFALPGVTGFGVDLNPAAGGSVSWRDLADRAVVTFQNVPEVATAAATDYYTEQFDGACDIAGRTFTFAPSPGGYTVSQKAAASFPTDPSGGTPLTLASSSSSEVRLAAGREVSLFGKSYSSFHVNSDGYLTFEGGRGTPPTLESHFSQPTLSGFATDLDPSQGGSVTWKDMPDRAVITFLDVPAVPQSAVQDFLTEYFPDTIDVANRRFLFTPSGNSYTVTQSTIESLPSDPADGAVLLLEDDDVATIAPASAVRLFGEEFGAIYVSSNGYLTFDEPSSWPPSLETHFSKRSIGAIARDLNPEAGGTVSWKNFPDRTAITFESVPDYGDASRLSTFQIELYFDGRIAISITKADADGCILGLSPGGGVPENFMSTDFSEYGAPPDLHTFQMELFHDGRIVITLLRVEALNGITGLSAGQGLPPEFTCTDFSTYHDSSDPPPADAKLNTFQMELFHDGRVVISLLRVDSPGAVIGLSSGTGLQPDFVSLNFSAIGQTPPPADPLNSKIVIASQKGSGVVDPARYPEFGVYYQNDSSLPGFNPNDEHAFKANALGGGGAVYALRDDLWNPAWAGIPGANSSKPFVLMHYRDPASPSSYRFRRFPVVATDTAYDFMVATPTPEGRHQWTRQVPDKFLPPHPMNSEGLYDVPASRVHPGSDNVFEDRNGELYALHAEGGGIARLDWQYPLSTAKGFYWPSFLPHAAEFSALIPAGGVSRTGQSFTLTFAGGKFRPLDGTHKVQLFNAGSNLASPLKEWDLTGSTDTTLRFTAGATDPVPAAGQYVRIVNRNVGLVWFLNNQTGPFSGNFTQEQTPRTVEYQLVWPSIPEHFAWTPQGAPARSPQDQVMLGQTTDAVGDINNQQSVEIIHDQANYLDSAAPAGPNVFNLDPVAGRRRSLKVIRWGSTSPGRAVTLALNNFPSGGPIEDMGAFKEFPTLSPALRKKIRYYLIHPTVPSLNQNLVCSGVKLRPLLGDDFFAVNVLTGAEAQELRDLANDSQFTWSNDPVLAKKNAFRSAVEALIAGCSVVDDISVPQYSGMDVSRFKSQAISAGDVNADGFVTLIFNNFSGALPAGKEADPPVSLKVLRVTRDLAPGVIHNLPDQDLTEIDEAGQTIQTDVFRAANPFEEKLDLMFSGDLAGSASEYTFEWKAIPASDWQRATGGIAQEDWPPYYPGASKDAGWDPANAPVGPRNLAIRAGQPYVMQSHYFITRYRPNRPTHPLYNQWSGWTEPKIVEGWLVRALKENSPFAERVSILDDLQAVGGNFSTTLIQAAGPPATEVALTPAGARNAGLIAIYQTLLDRGRSLSLGIDLTNDDVNRDLLTAAGKLSDLYLLLGNEAYADAADPTVPVGDGTTQISSPGNVHAFMGFENINSLLDEELALLRGRDSLGATGVNKFPVYNRIAWYLDTGSAINPQAASVYYNNYNLGASSAATPLLRAKDLYPMGHGDAWGHYLSAQRNYYDLLRNPNFKWIPRFQVISVSGGNAQIDRFEERRFAEVAAAKARTGLEITKLTHRKHYLNNDPGLFSGATPDAEQAHWQGYKDLYRNSSGNRRAWGVDDWAARTGEGAYLDWVTGNALLPETDPDPNNTGIRRLDRRSVTELDEIAQSLSEAQKQLDTVDAGLSPLGIADNALLFDIDAAQYNAGRTHFEQVFERAKRDIVNAYAVFRDAQGLSEGMRQQFDSQANYNEKADEQNFDYRNRLVEIFGYPYSSDTAYPFGYNGPDILHYMYVDPSAVLGLDEGKSPTEVVTLRFRDIALSNFSFDGTRPTTLNYSVQQIDVPFHRSTTGYGFVKPSTWGERKAPGEIQQARGDVIQSRYRIEKARLEYDLLVSQIEDQVQLLEARTGLNAANYAIQYGSFLQSRSLSDEIKRSRRNQLVFRTIGRVAESTSNAVAEGIPTNMIVIAGMANGVGGDYGAPARAATRLMGARINEIFSSLADEESLRELGHQQAKEEIQTLSNLRITAANAEYEALAEVRRIEALIRQESVLRLELYSLYDSFQQTGGRYQMAIARGERLLDEYIRFRQRTAGEVSSARYRDLAFRIFRDEKLEKYRAHFDQAAQSLCRAGLALDYEINWKGFAPDQRRDFLSKIVRSRAIGDASGGTPAIGAGDAGLAGIYAQMEVAWQTARSVLRLDNPEVAPEKRISLRNELFRIPAATRMHQQAWRAAIESAVVHDLGEVADFVKHCDFEWNVKYSPALNAFVRQPEQGVVLMFPTVIASQLNTFGFPFNQQIDSRFVSTSFANRITNVGIWLRGVSSLSPTANVEAYLVPVGNDILRNPLYRNSLLDPDLTRFSEWKVLEEVLPMPIFLSRGTVNGRADVLTQNLPSGWIPSLQGSSSAALNFGDGGTLYSSQNVYPFAVRRYGAFLANHDNVSQANTSRSSRLVGRSVWNTRWMLVIPERSIPAAFLLDQLTDIELLINYKQYSPN